MLNHDATTQNLGMTFPDLFRHTLNHYPDNIAWTFVGEEPVTYRQADELIRKTAGHLHKLGIQKGDRVAILSTNMPEWGIAYFAITFMGAIAAPLLPDFTSEEIKNILEHSESKAIFVSEGLTPKIKDLNLASLQHRIPIEKIHGLKDDSLNLEYHTPSPEDLAAIIYTSGTTGRSKGVMLTHRNICSNAHQGISMQEILPTDRFISILPLSHTLENTLCLILPMKQGASVYYLRKPPTASVLLPALKTVRPTIMLTVPLIIEKIFRNSVKPNLVKKPIIRSLYNTKLFRPILHKVAGRKLMETFGGELRFFGIGGAKLNPEVEQFLIDAHFPYAIGYGLTETSPLLAGATPGKTRLESTGPAVIDVELKIYNPDEKGQGEIWARGPNIMKGYYKDEEATREVLTEDGWFRTGDMGVMAPDGYLFIRGRSKSMIVGSSGENIYPEDIESVINGFQHVVESLVIEQKGRLVALVHFNKEEIEEKYQHIKEEVTNYVEHKIEDLKRDLMQHVNSKVKKLNRVHAVHPHPEPFQRTATQKIKRYLYESDNLA